MTNEDEATYRRYLNDVDTVNVPGPVEDIDQVPESETTSYYRRYLNDKV